MDELSLSTIEEMRMLVSLGTSVLPAVPKVDLVSTSGFGGIHAAIMGLAARTLGSRHWTDKIKPVTDEEFAALNVRAPAHGKSRFRVRVQEHEVALRKTILAYLGAASDFTGEFRLRARWEVT